MAPVLHHEHDGTDAALSGLPQPDPLVMYLVAPHRPAGSTEDLLADAARAALRCARSFGDDPGWADAFAEWEESSFRKVCLRASAQELEAASRLPHAAAGDVLCFPPRRRSAAEPELAHLRAHTGGPLIPRDGVPVDPPLGAMVLLIDETLGLTAGKACAQVAHAILIAVQLHPPAAIAAWQGSGCPLTIGLVDSGTLDRVKRELRVVAVRDAGFTQVRPGTETVLATEPAPPGPALPDWLRSAMKPIA